MKLGDFVAEGIHIVTGIEPCGGCNERREWLNDLGDSLVNRIDLLRGRGNVESMTYQVTVNTQKQYRVEADSSDEALKKIGPENETFTATTNNVRIQPTAISQVLPPSPASASAQ